MLECTELQTRDNRCKPHVSFRQSGFFVEKARVSGHVFVAAAGKINDYEIVCGEARRPGDRQRPTRNTGVWGIGRIGRRDAFDETGDGVGGFQCGDDAFRAREELCGVESGGVGDSEILGATLVGEPGVFGTDGRIVETGGNGVSGSDLAVLGLQNISVSTLQNARTRSGEPLRGG